MTGVLSIAGRQFAHVFRLPTYRRIVLITALLYLLMYLYSIQHIVYLRAATVPLPGFPAFQVAPDWPLKLWRAIAPYAYEPVAALYLTPRLVILLAVPNLLLGLLLAILVGVNLSLAVHQFRAQYACRRSTVSGFLGSLPSLLTGFTCCVPTVAIVLGANSVLALIALRVYLIPVSIALLAGGAVWGAWRAGQANAVSGPARLSLVVPPGGSAAR
ncbi:MAG: hypothetical protein ACRDF5_01595 [bacterium]